MHSKVKGTLGELKIAADLVSKGYQVFTEFGDNSKIDLIAVDDNYNLYKIQIKSLKLKKSGAVEVQCVKSGPNYRFRYQKKHADVYAVYIPNEDIILYISSEELLSNKKSLTIRINKPLNGQSKKIKFASEYFDFRKALRDYTCNT